MTRDNFSDAVKNQISLKSGFRCSNPDCPARTRSYTEDGERVINTGVVAHICAASPNGPRYDASMTRKERAGEENGILLCSKCAALIDRDVSAYPPEKLREWKKAAYQAERERHSGLPDRPVDPRFYTTIQEMVCTCLTIYQTEGTVSKQARFRSYAGILYRLLFEDMVNEADYGKQEKLWICAVETIASDALESVRCRIASYDHSFPRRYRYFMEELNTYSVDIQTQKNTVLDVVENAVQSLFQTGKAFGLNK